MVSYLNATYKVPPAYSKVKLWDCYLNYKISFFIVVSPTKDVLKNEENQMPKNNLNIIVFNLEQKDNTRGCNPSLSNCKAEKNV